VSALKLEADLEHIHGLRFVMYHGDKPHAYFRGADIGELVGLLPPTKPSFTMKFAGSEGYEVASPFRISLKDRQYVAEIEWVHKRLTVCVELGLGELPTALIQSKLRDITSSEHHYYTGRSFEELANTTITTYTFGPGATQQYYGGTSVCKDPEVVLKVIEHLTKGKTK
jgi:hypothetical protein